MESQKHRTVRNRGLVNEMTDSPAKAYEEKHPDRAVRYVYNPPAAGPEADYLMKKRQLQGYSVVRGNEIGEKTEHSAGNEPIRIGDVVLMSIPRDLKEAEMKSRAEDAREQARLSESEYYEYVRGIQAGRHRGRPTGTIRTGTEVIRAEPISSKDL